MVLVAHIVKKNPVTVAPSTSLRSVASVMRSRNVGSVLIVGDTGRLMGIFTERDLVRAVSDNVNLDSARVEDYMSKEPIVARPEDSIVSAAHKMVHHGIRHLPVVDDGGRLIGIVSMRDVLRHLLAENEFP